MSVETKTVLAKYSFEVFILILACFWDKISYIYGTECGENGLVSSLFDKNEIDNPKYQLSFTHRTENPHHLL